MIDVRHAMGVPAQGQQRAECNSAQRKRADEASLSLYPATVSAHTQREPKVGRTPRGSYNRTLFKRVLRRFLISAS